MDPRHHSDFARELFNHGADLVDIQKAQSELAKSLKDVEGTPEYADFVKELQADKVAFKRLKQGFIDLFQSAEDCL